MKPKRILLLGATGSIGTQTIDVIDQHPERFELVGVSAGHQEQKLKEIVDSHPSIQCVGPVSYTHLTLPTNREV